jgi:hypothetical protein
MRAFITAVLALAWLAVLAPPDLSPVFAQESCRCKGCGCKGGPRWRGTRRDFSQARLGEICGSPPGAPCVKEAATRVCYGDKSASNEAKPSAE